MLELTVTVGKWSFPTSETIAPATQTRSSHIRPYPRVSCTPTSTVSIRGKCDPTWGRGKCDPRAGSGPFQPESLHVSIFAKRLTLTRTRIFFVAFRLCMSKWYFCEVPTMMTVYQTRVESSRRIWDVGGVTKFEIWRLVLKSQTLLVKNTVIICSIVTPKKESTNRNDFQDGNSMMFSSKFLWVSNGFQLFGLFLGVALCKKNLG